MGEDYNKKYLDFASNISFYEFLQDEFKPPHFKVEGYSEEINKLESKTDWDVNALSDFLKKHPKSFEIFQEIFQLVRFTNTQLTHFLFDVNLLNNNNNEELKKYLVENIKRDDYFFKICTDELKKKNIQVDTSNPDKLIKEINEKNNLTEFFILILKIVVFRYVSDCVNKEEILHKRLSNSQDVSERTAKYLIENLKLNNALKGIKVKDFLSNKRIAKDTKSIHGKFGNIKIKNILEKHNITNADELFNELKINELNNKIEHPELKQFSNKTIFVTEKYIGGIKKRKDNKLKKFDFIILQDLKPKILIETNFFSTSGTKIGINQGEYVDLKEDIEKSSNYKFLWITDGNYWLTSEGYSRLINLYNYFGNQILNYNLFDKKLQELIKK